MTETRQRRKMQAEYFIQGSTAWMIGTGLMLGLCDGLGLSYTMVLVGLSSGIGVCWSAGMRGKRYGAAVGISGLLALLMLLFVCRDHFLNGTFYFYNEAAKKLGKSGLCILQEYRLFSEETAWKDAQGCLAVFSLAAGWGSYALVVTEKRFLPTAGLGLAAVFLWIHAEQNAGWMLLGLGSVFWMIEQSYVERNANVVQHMSAAVLFSWAAVAGCLVTAVYAGNWLLPKQSYEEPQVVKQIRTDVLQKVDQLRYQKKEINTLPKGNLAEAENWETTEETALRVKMSTPTSLYLRGFVGSVYDTDHWEALSQETYYDYQELFYWLKQWGFSGASQLSVLRELLEDETLAKEIVTIEIENVNADSEYLYLPYEFVSFEEDSLGQADGYMDQSAAAKGLFGKRSYSYLSYQNLIKDFPKLAAQGYLYRKEHPQELYTEAESYYNVFVYENFTQIPENVRTLLEKELGYAGEETEAHADYRSVITKLRAYLEKNITYGNYAEKLPEGEDFLSFFLTEAKIGSSVHYAAAATLMFRYYGIPARYVEGYLITPQDVQQQGEVIELTGSSGHAWTEIYVDGLGWVPIEMTPEYYGVMEEADLNIGLQTDASRVITPPQTQLQEPEKNTKEQLKEHLTQIFLNLGKWILGLLILFDLGCLFLFLYLQIRRLAANLKRHRQFGQKDSRQAVCSMTKYMKQLTQEAEQTLPEEIMTGYIQAYRIGQKAAFSQHRLSEEERKKVEVSRKLLVKAVKKEKGWYDRWILKYIKRLY